RDRGGHPHRGRGPGPADDGDRLGTGVPAGAAGRGTGAAGGDLSARPARRFRWTRSGDVQENQRLETHPVTSGLPEGFGRRWPDRVHAAGGREEGIRKPEEPGVQRPEARPREEDTWVFSTR